MGRVVEENVFVRGREVGRRDDEDGEQRGRCHGLSGDPGQVGKGGGISCGEWRRCPCGPDPYGITLVRTPVDTIDVTNAAPRTSIDCPN